MSSLELCFSSDPCRTPTPYTPRGRLRLSVPRSRDTLASRDVPPFEGIACLLSAPKFPEAAFESNTPRRQIAQIAHYNTVIYVSRHPNHRSSPNL